MPDFLCLAAATRRDACEVRSMQRLAPQTNTATGLVPGMSRGEGNHASQAAYHAAVRRPTRSNGGSPGSGR